MLAYPASDQTKHGHVKFPGMQQAIQQTVLRWAAERFLRSPYQMFDETRSPV
ncbi:hypothetical protein [Nostoc commune]|uniref:hypothetical protein n=1 Tax=Nostoc commune TaxID=1178 RepID=UPI0015E80B84|nr:hypothetical protein [Nostoc commune]